MGKNVIYLWCIWLEPSGSGRVELPGLKPDNFIRRGERHRQIHSQPCNALACLRPQPARNPEAVQTGIATSQTAIFQKYKSKENSSLHENYLPLIVSFSNSNQSHRYAQLTKIKPIKLFLMIYTSSFCAYYVFQEKFRVWKHGIASYAAA